MHFLGQLILILLTTVLLGQLFARFNMPAVIGQLLSGILLGPAILNWVKPNDIISLFSEFGVILLMFLAGLESDLDLLKKYFKLSFTVATVGVILPVVFMGLASCALLKHSLSGLSLQQLAFLSPLWCCKKHTNCTPVPAQPFQVLPQLTISQPWLF